MKTLRTSAHWLFQIFQIHRKGLIKSNKEIKVNINGKKSSLEACHIPEYSLTFRSIR